MIAKSTTIQVYQLRARGTRARMAILRMIAADSVNNRNGLTRLQPGDWRGARHYKMNNYESAYGTISQGLDGETQIWYCNNDGKYFRKESDAHRIATSLLHGWYIDPHYESLAIGIVASLTHGRFIAGYRWTKNDERVYFGEVFTDEHDAARMADKHARVFAKTEMEYQIKFDEAYKLNTLIEDKEKDVCELREKFHRHIAACYDTITDSVTWKRLRKERLEIREEAREIIQDIRAFRDELKRDYAGVL